MTGSRQLRDYLAARETMDREAAAEIVGMSVHEARLTDVAKERGEIDLPPWPSTHNQPEEAVMAEGSIAADELRLLIERIERLEEEKKAITDDVKDVYGEAKARGYDTKTMRRIVQLRKMESHDLQEAEALLSTYAAAVGLQTSFL
jgi:uncharacterized protein (UPF0335 family)